MRIRFSLDFLKAGQPVPKAFKMQGALSLFQEYTTRTGRMIPCETGSYPSNGKSVTWVCEREQKSRVLSSTDLARELEKVMTAGAQELQIVIGGPDGFTKEALEEMKPVLRWSFGSMTLPHELAAVVASEQIYRALTIIRRHPYHSGH
jgi:23S rRNA (pseudouridine1915-N3)-methyltransferase